MAEIKQTSRLFPSLKQIPDVGTEARKFAYRFLSGTAVPHRFTQRQEIGVGGQAKGRRCSHLCSLPLLLWAPLPASCQDHHRHSPSCPRYLDHIHLRQNKNSSTLQSSVYIDRTYFIPTFLSSSCLVALETCCRRRSCPPASRQFNFARSSPFDHHHSQRHLRDRYSSTSARSHGP